MPSDKYKIIWQKWVDPFGNDIDEAKSVDYDNEIGLFSKKDFDSDSDIEEDHPKIIQSKKSIKVIASPMGLIPYNEHTASSKIFNFWLGHSNFDITTDIATIIESTDGVETLDIFTRYRFRIAIGKCFGDSETMIRIQNNIFRHLDDKEHQRTTPTTT